jgi:hypothetical protein
LGVLVEELTEGLAAPTRTKGLERVLAALDEQPGSATSRLAISAELPEVYVWKGLRYLASARRIRYQGGRWQPDVRGSQRGA